MKTQKRLIYVLYSIAMMSWVVSCSYGAESSSAIQIPTTPQTQAQTEIVAEINRTEAIINDSQSTQVDKNTASGDLIFAQQMATMVFAPTRSTNEIESEYNAEMTKIAEAESQPKPVAAPVLGYLSSDQYALDAPRFMIKITAWQGYINERLTLIYAGIYYPYQSNDALAEITNEDGTLQKYGVVHIVTQQDNGEITETTQITDEETGALTFKHFNKGKQRLVFTYTLSESDCNNSDGHTNGNGQNNGNGHNNHNGNGHSNCANPCNNGNGNGNGNKNKNNNGNCGNGNGNSNKIYFDLATGQFVSSLNEPVSVTPTPIPPSTPTPEPASVAYP